MLKTFEISFTVYLDDDKNETNSSLSYLTTTVTAFISQQAQAMIEAQYNGRVRVWSVIQL
jgi:hypothetical protein